MKKNLLNWMTILMVAIVSIGFVSCGDDDDEKKDSVASIVGTWVGTVDGQSVTYQYNADNTGSIISGDVSIRFTYSYDKDSRYLTIEIMGETHVFQIYTLTSTTLSGKNVKTGGIISFKRTE